MGKTLGEIDLRGASGANLVAIERTRRFSRDVIGPTAKTELQSGDILLVDLFAPNADIEALRQRFALEALPLSGAYFSDRAQEIGMAEVMVAADSELVGKTVVDAKFRTRYRLTVIGLRHGRVALERGLLNEPLRIGDTLLLIGPWKDIERLRSDTTDLLILNLPAELDEVLPVAGKAPQALFCLVLMVVLMVSGVVPNVQAALIACLLMGALGCIDLDTAYRSIHWKSLVLIVGMLPFSIALQKTGGVDLAADALMALTGGAGTYVVLGEPLCHHRPDRSLHLQHRHRRADGPGRSGHCERLAGVALSVRDDRRAGRLHGVHDADLLPGEHAGGRPRRLCLRRFRARRGALCGGRHDRQRHPRALVAAPALVRGEEYAHAIRDR